MGLHAWMPMLAFQDPQARWIRGCVAGATGVFAVAMVGHQGAHVLKGDKPVALLHLLDICHHGVSLWVTAVAVRWARAEPARRCGPPGHRSDL